MEKIASRYTGRASVRRRGKKHRLVVEVESLAKEVDELSTKIRVIYL